MATDADGRVIAISITRRVRTSSRADRRRARAVSRGSPERRGPHPEPFGIWTFIGSARLQDRRAVESLRTAAEHGTIVLVEQSPSDMHDAARIDPEKVAIVRKVMDRAQGNSVHDVAKPCGSRPSMMCAAWRSVASRSRQTAHRVE